jgi:uncharacterized protein YjbJ (UPF0337 family)
MSGADKARKAAERLKGKGKETAGKAVRDERLEAEGKTDQVKGGLKQAGEKAKDAGKKVKEALKKSAKG